jgi:hypothetical protein
VTDHEPALVARAWHDVTCPEGADCRDRLLHSAAQPLANTGWLDLFLRRLEDLEQREQNLTWLVEDANRNGLYDSTAEPTETR